MLTDIGVVTARLLIMVKHIRAAKHEGIPNLTGQRLESIKYSAVSDDLLECIEAVIQRCSVKQVFLEILQNLQEDTCARVSFLIKLQASGLQLYLKKRLWRRCFPVNIEKFLRTPFLQNTSGRLLLKEVVLKE